MIKTIALILLVSSCSMQKKSLHQGWKSILSIDNNGLVLSGEKQNLIDAIHMGCPIRVGWFRKLRNDETLGHVTDSAFLSVYKGEVFAQVKPIMRQSPSSAKAAIQLDFENNQQWTAIILSLIHI